MLAVANDIPKVIYQYELALFETLIAIEKVLEGDRNNYQNNHILLIYEYNMDARVLQGKEENDVPKLKGRIFQDAISSAIEEVKSIYYRRYFQALDQCNVTTIELLCKASCKTTPPPVLRIVLDIPYRRCVRITPYLEIVSKGKRVFHPIGGPKGGPFDSVCVDAATNGPAHIVNDPLVGKRIMVKKNDSVYAYDWIQLFTQALQQVWKKQGRDFPNCVQARELIVEDGDLIEIDREIGKNDVGMVAWIITLYTPEYEDGREIVVVSNELSFKVGTFGVPEDNLFMEAIKLARSKGIPFVYMSCNSGARIGLAAELMHRFQIAWVMDPVENTPTGADYLYLLPEDYEELQDSVTCEEIEVDGEKRYKITAIIGKDEGLGVENLSGSGMIAGEVSRAYDEICTLNYVSGRSVGIGAYLVRLGQRIIQKAGSPILLTGFQALNNLLRKRVYLSNVQLGGLGIMCPNGVCHVPVQDDLAGVEQIINWISYLPKTKYEVQLPAIEFTDKTDPVDRDVGYMPMDQDDPKLMIDGKEFKGNWESGFFDRGSFTETLSQWAKGIVVGRARLGGIPVGVIVVNTQTTTKIVPPDPANEESNESKMQRAGKVWFPDSSFKTANSIKDMNREGLPLIMFANMRGFSGGASDMFNEVLKFGSYIVDALREYKQPVSVYIPPKGEIRGGAWVVLDTLINPEFIEMYASESARGGVLEANATASLKYRGKNFQTLMNRTDPVLKDLLKQKQDVETKEAIKKRQQYLSGLYRQATIEFADLHDRPQRMVAKNAVRAIVPWKNSRRHFYWRLRRKLHLQRIFKRTNDDTCMSDVQKCFDELIQQHLPEAFSNDEAVARWCDENAERMEKISQELHSRVVMSQMSALASAYPGDMKELFSKLKSEIAKQQSKV
jgi:acetyl-CoA carboxylase/biotin carboxylase 1